ncbi:PAAR domain-containing protein [Pseudomonas syringae]|uniref:PAAR domain-containing protein n=1 Tax=Pseudomonas syringae TaxID=317 RepID=UPI00067B862B|nr:PAAR domain-containing protein [Pseudomonas syringae]
MEINTTLTERYTNEESAEFLSAQPPIAIYRLATQGSQTRNGGVIQQATTKMEITLSGGQIVRVAQVGDEVQYPDGSTAQIVTGSGQETGDMALVGSRLSNGDEIIDTPQGTVYFVHYEGIPMAEDFLPPVEG